jgi:hypothetical protein
MNTMIYILENIIYTLTPFTDNMEVFTLFLNIWDKRIEPYTVNPKEDRYYRNH